MTEDDVSFDLLRAFHAVHRTGSPTEAARQLGLPEPTVTAQLEALEAVIGQLLFARHAGGVAPTAAGDDLARRLDQPMDALAGVAKGLAQASALRGCTLHIGGPAELITDRVLPALVDTMAAGVAVRTRLGVAEELLSGLAAGDLDLVVSAVRPRSQGLCSAALCVEEFLLLAAPSMYARVDREMLAEHPARALHELPLLSYGEDLPIVRRWWRHVLGVPPTGRPALVVPDLRGLRAATIAGAGITVLPRYLCASDLAAGRLVQVLETDDPPINTLYLARAGNRSEPHITHAWHALVLDARSW